MSIKQIFSNFKKQTIKDTSSQGVNQSTISFNFTNPVEQEQKIQEKIAQQLLKICFFSIPTSFKIMPRIARYVKKIQLKFKDNHTRTLFSNATFSHTADKVYIHIFYYISTYEKNKNKYKYKNKNKYKQIKQSPQQKKLLSNLLISLSKELSDLFEKEVCFSVTKIHYPYLNANIFAQYLGHNSSSNTFVQYYKSILTYPSLYVPSRPLVSYIRGIKIKVSGRLSTQRVIPRITTKSAIYGSFADAPVVDYGQCTIKNYLGTFTIKV